MRNRHLDTNGVTEVCETCGKTGRGGTTSLGTNNRHGFDTIDAFVGTFAFFGILGTLMKIDEAYLNTTRFHHRDHAIPSPFFRD